jgi:hypothetical protein
VIEAAAVRALLARIPAAAWLAVIGATAAFGAWQYVRSLQAELASRDQRLEQMAGALRIIQDAAVAAEGVLDDRDAELARLRRAGAGTVRRVLYCPDPDVPAAAAGGAPAAGDAGRPGAAGPDIRDIGPLIYGLADDYDRLAVNHNALIDYTRRMDQACRKPSR